LKGADKKKIVLIAGRKSHGYGSHEHLAGCKLFAKALNESGLPVRAEAYGNGWPEDARELDDADAIVLYSDGGGRHPFIPHIDELDKLMKKGVGMVCMHYGVEVPKGKPGDALLDWIGGYFEAHWSVNPHWTAHFEKYPKHPITNGVGPLSMNDEWYYHMRFRENMEGVTPILSDLPPADTLKRKDGPHSNNPFVRAAVLERKEPQHLAWAYERPDGGRGFGFTGGHYHWSWGHDDFRKLILNAIVWTAGIDVPANGVPSKTPTVEELQANQDYPQPANFDRARIQKMLDEWNRTPPSAK
jgi:type 1 glutamine amidotransferase